MGTENSRQFFEDAQHVIPGGVNSPVRAFGSVEGSPIFVKKGKGSKIWDVDDNQYIDYVCSWGPLILGHNPPAVVDAIKKVCSSGTSFGAPTKIEVDIAKLITQVMPSIEMVRMVNSGTEATMSAVRLARGYTGRNKIIKFEGCYHGHGDSFLIQAGSGVATLGIPGSPGVTEGTASDTLTAKYNDLDSVRQLVKTYPKQIAALIVEPIAGNMGMVPPADGFLWGLREITRKERIVLIFDEVITGFRVALGGAQIFYGVSPDLTTLGKIIGGGLPVGAYGGKKEIMEKLAPIGPVYQAGTLSGNPLAMTAGYETLKILSESNVYEGLEKKASYLAEGISNNIKRLNLPIKQTRVGSMLCLFFTDADVKDFDTAKTADAKKYGIYFHEMLNRGIYLAPSQFETAFLSTAHTEKDLDKTIKANYEALEKTCS